MRKIRDERPSKPQQNHLGMDSNASIALDVATRRGAVLAGTPGGNGWGEMAMRAVSFFGLG
jgi:hypothetical protein